MKTMKVRSRSPLRIGFGGGGTDLNSYCDLYGGHVLNATISLSTYCLIIPKNNKKIIFSSPDYNEKATLNSSNFLEIDGNMNLHKGVYNRIIKDYNIEPLSFELITFSDAPPGGSGLGGSSTLVVSIIKCFSEWLDLPMGEYDIAKLAYDIERNDIGIEGGAQDQYAATFGGFNFMNFNKDSSVIVNPLDIKNDFILELQSSMILYHTNITRKASQIEVEKKELISNKKSIDSMHRVKEDALKMKSAILKGDIKGFANLLHDSWMAKKSISKNISNKEIDRIYSLALDNGALAGKVSGAGGGGFMFFIVPPEKKFQLKKALDSQKGTVYDFIFDFDGAKSWKT